MTKLNFQHHYFSQCLVILYIYIYIYAFSRRFYPKRLTITFRLYILISMCVPWESNPQPFALLTQCSTTEPHRNTLEIIFNILICCSYILILQTYVLHDFLIVRIPLGILHILCILLRSLLLCIFHILRIRILLRTCHKQIQNK